MASAVHNAARQLGGTLGVAVMGSVVIAHSAAGTPDAFASGLRAAMLTAGACLVLAIAGLLLLTRTRGVRTCAT
jgi:hypothetical protein